MILIRSVNIVSVQGVETRDFIIKHAQEEEIDGTGLYLLPGLIDAHVHFRDPGNNEKEDWLSGSKAALAGGVTMVLDMPNTNPPSLTVAALEAKRSLAKSKSLVNFGLFFGASKNNLEEIRAAQNICGIKIYMGSSTGDLVLDDPIVWEAVFKIAKEKNIPVVVHAETESMIRSGQRDCECARVATETAIALREKIGNHLHIAHVSCKAELELIRKHKSPKLTCEVTPHHLFFTQLDQKDAFLKMNPPLRSKADQDALWDGIKDGTIDCIATDHAPHTALEKQSAAPPAGVPGIEFMLPLLLNAVKEGRLELSDVVRLTSQNPGKIFAVNSGGWTLVDMNLTKTIEAKDIKSKCGWSPYEGKILKAWPIRTWLEA